jgi:predicted HTH transcriptional regulator
MGRAEADISSWLEYFCLGMAHAFESVYRQAKREEATPSDDGVALRQLDSRQKKALGLFQKSDFITSQNISKLFAIQPRTARVLCHKWVEAGFIITADPAKKSRKYRLAKKYEGLLKS